MMHDGPIASAACSFQGRSCLFPNAVCTIANKASKMCGLFPVISIQQHYFDPNNDAAHLVLPPGFPLKCGVLLVVKHEHPCPCLTV